MKIKGLLVSLLVLSTVVTLTACGKTGTKTGGEPTSPTTSPTTNDTQKEPVEDERVQEAEIEVYAPKGKNTDYLLQATELYNQKYGTKLTLKPVDVAPGVPMVQKITPQLVAGEKMPELIFMQDANAGAIFEKFEDEFIASEDLGFVNEYGADFYPAKMNMLENIAPSKKVYGFPNDWGNSVMFFNNAAFVEAGVDMENDVETWDDLIEAGKKLKAATGKNLLFMRNTGELDLVKYIAEQQNTVLFDKDGNLDLVNDSLVNAYAILKKIADADLVSYGEAGDYYSIGMECGVIFAGGWLASYQATDYPDEAGNWRIAAMPKVSADQAYVAPMSGGSSYYILKNSKNPEAAAQLITFILTDPEALDIYMNLKGLPANTTAYSSAAGNQGFEFYGDQKILLVLNNVSKNSIQGYVFPYSADLNNYIEQASYEIQFNGVDVKEALSKQAKDFASKYGVEVIGQ